MFKVRFSILSKEITILFVICFCTFSAHAKYGGGTGEPSDPYLIYTAEQTNEIGLNESDWGSHFKLMADIDLFAYTGTSFNIIGYYIDNRNQRPFSGVFDGNGHTISNFTYTSTDVSYIGPFGYVHGSDAKIKNLGLIDPNVDAGTGRFVGLLVGRLRRGTIMNCYVENGYVTGDRTVGGLVGETYVSTVNNCYSSSSVTGTKLIGGLVGLNYSSEISNCSSEGIVSGSQEVGGLVGSNRNGTINNCYSSSSVTGTIYTAGLGGRNRDGTITNSYSTGSVSGTSCVGGLVGWNMDTITNCYSSSSVSGDERVGGLVGDLGGTITNCYSTGTVIGTTDVGGLVGYKGHDDEVFNSFWDIETSGQTTSAGGMPKTTDEMQTVNTFILWVCPPVWTIDEGLDYPRFWWENKPGKPITKPSYGGGSGEPNAPYLIYTADQLNTIGLIVCDWDKHFKLMADIDLSAIAGKSFNIIGTWQPYRPFTGVFDGNDYKISNFTYDSNNTDYIGLFGYVRGSDAKIKSLGLIDPNVDAGTGRYVGSLVGWLKDGTINNCYVQCGSVAGEYHVGGLVGVNYDTISNCCATGSVSGDNYIGGLCGWNDVTINNCYFTGGVEGDFYVGGLVGLSDRDSTISNCYSEADISGYDYVGGLVGYNEYHGKITDSYATGDFTGLDFIGGLVGNNYHGTITNSYATGSASGDDYIGGLVGGNKSGGITFNCYSMVNVIGTTEVGGLVGSNKSGSTISNCYSIGNVIGTTDVGGLVGRNFYKITNCYSTGFVSGDEGVGGLVGYNDDWGSISNCFWDTDTSGRTTSAGGTGLPTGQMQMQITFTDAGWDFDTPIWKMCEFPVYPKLWWQLCPLPAPVLQPEPEVTLGISNTISWEPVVGGIEYYAECATESNFVNIYNSGWITDTNCTFWDLNLGQQYWYSVKARNAEGVESLWSNVESSMQGTLLDAVDIMLDPNSLKNENTKNALLNKIDATMKMIDLANYTGALSKLEHDILAKTNGCAESGWPDKNDWIITCEGQSEIYPLIIETIEHVKALMAE